MLHMNYTPRFENVVPSRENTGSTFAFENSEAWPPVETALDRHDKQKRPPCIGTVILRGEFLGGHIIGGGKRQKRSQHDGARWTKTLAVIVVVSRRTSVAQYSFSSFAELPAEIRPSSVP